MVRHSAFQRYLHFGNYPSVVRGFLELEALGCKAHCNFSEWFPSTVFVFSTDVQSWLLLGKLSCVAILWVYSALCGFLVIVT